MIRASKERHQISDMLHRVTQSSEEWLNDLSVEFPFSTLDQAYSILQAVLHALRDRLPPELALHLSAQLPLLLRGIYIEGWRLQNKAFKEKHIEDFLAEVAKHWGPRADMDYEEMTRAVFRLLSRRISKGEIEKVKSALPNEIRELWD